MIWRGRLRAIALGWAALAATAPASGAPVSTRLCKAVADRIATLPVANTESKGPIERLAGRSGSIVTLDAKEVTRFGDQSEVTAYTTAAAKRLPAPDATELLSAVRNDSGVAFRRLGRTSIQAFELHNGSMNCIDFQFFTERGGQAKPVANPPQYAALSATGEQPRCFAMGNHGLLGVVAGMPAFITEGRRLNDYNYTVSIAAWNGRHWGRPCAIEAFYRPIYSVGGINCGAGLCGPLKALAPKLAQAVHDHEIARKREPFAWLKSGGQLPSDLRSLHQQVWAVNRDDLPRPHLEIMREMANTRDIFPVRIAGRDYMALMGHTGRGDWAEPGFVLILFQSQKGAAQPVASLLIESRQGALIVNRYGRWRSTYGALNPHHSALY